MENGFEKAYTPYHEGFYGWYGAGGSVHQWNPELKIGFGFATSTLLQLDLTNSRSINLMMKATSIVK